MGVFDAFTADWREGDYTEMESTTIDLSSPDGLKELERRISQEVNGLYGYHMDGNAWERLAGRSLAEVADDLTRDLMQEPIALPVGAYADPEGAGRELRVIRNVAAYMYRRSLEYFMQNALARGIAFPSGRSAPPSSVSSVSSQQHRQQLQK